MAILAASLLAADFSCLKEQLCELQENGISYLHIDVMDGLFVPSLSFGLPVVETLRKAYDGVFDVHLMIQEPIRYVEPFAKAGSDIITVHLEACTDVRETLKQIHACGCKTGLSIKPGTEIEAVYPYLDEVDMLLIMTVEPGFGGQKYLHSMTDKICRCRDYLDRNCLQTMIEVDGGINPQTIGEAYRAGADIFVSGSSVFCGNITENIKALQEIITQTGRNAC